MRGWHPSVLVVHRAQVFLRRRQAPVTLPTNFEEGFDQNRRPAPASRGECVSLAPINARGRTEVAKQQSYLRWCGIWNGWKADVSGLIEAYYFTG